MIKIVESAVLSNQKLVRCEYNASERPSIQMARGQIEIQSLKEALINTSVNKGFLNCLHRASKGKYALYCYNLCHLDLTLYFVYCMLADN